MPPYTHSAQETKVTLLNVKGNTQGLPVSGPDTVRQLLAAAVVVDVVVVLLVVVDVVVEVVELEVVVEVEQVSVVQT